MNKKNLLALGLLVGGLTASSSFATDVTLSDVVTTLQGQATAAIGVIVAAIVVILGVKFVWTMLPAAYRAIVRVVRGA